jgi:hypothetical protein
MTAHSEIKRDIDIRKTSFAFGMLVMPITE